MKRVAALVALVALGGCARTTVTVLTQAPPGRTASLDVESRTLTLTQGLAVALECTEYDEDDGYSGPCRDMTISAGDSSLVDVLPVHLDALDGDTVSARDTGSAVAGPATRQGAVVAARAAGETTLDVAARAGPLSFSLVVQAPPTPPGDE